MIEVYDWKRKTGKTKHALRVLEHDPQAVMIVIGPRQRQVIINNLADKSIRCRIIAYTGDNIDVLKREMEGRYISKVVVDEGFSYRMRDLVTLYYTLGEMGLDVIVYGTSGEQDPLYVLPNPKT